MANNDDKPAGNSTARANRRTGKASINAKPAATTAKPARHAAPTRKPVTIDADAKPVAKGATPPAAAPSIPKPPMPSKPASSATKTAPSSPASTTTAPPPSAAKPVAATRTAERKPSSGSGILSLATAALLGGVVAIGGAWLLGILGAQNQEAALASRVEQTQFETVRNDLETRLAALEQTPAAAPSFDRAAIDAAVDARLAEVTANADASGPDAEVLTGLQANIAAATQRLETLEGAESARSARLDQLDAAISSGSAGETAGLAAMTSQSASQGEEIAALQEEVGQLAAAVEAGGSSSTLQTLQAEVADATEAATVNGTAIENIRQQVAAVDERMATIETRLADAAATGQSAVQASQQAANELREAIAELSTQVDAKLAAQAASGAEQLASLTDRLDNGADKIAARALAAAALKRDIDQGEPFASSLATLKSVAPDAAALAPLEPFADSGVPRAAELRSRFDEVSDAIISATAPEPANTSLTDKLFSGARNFVKVRPLAAVEGDDPSARVSQIAAALDEGRLQAASDVWKALPEPGRTASAQWHDALAARVLADKLVADTVDSFLQQSASPTTDG